MIQTKTVDITPMKITLPVIEMSQYDLGRQVIVHMKDGSDWFDLTGYTAKLQGTKPSGFGYTVDGVVDGHDITFASNYDMTSEAGFIPSEVRLTKNGVSLGSLNVILHVEKTPHDVSVTDGSPETIVPEITELVERAEAAAEVLLDCSAIATTLPAGSNATASYDVDNGVFHFGIPRGNKGETGDTGATGNGIASITKTGTSGLVDTYTIAYTDGTSTTFTVTNGRNGTGSVADVTQNGVSVLDGTTAKVVVPTKTSDLTNDSGFVTSVPTKTSDLTNDSNFVSDGSYIHTDNNFTTAEKTKLSGIASGAEVNVQSDWNATSGDALILNKPTNVSAFTNDAGYITAETDPTVPSWAKASSKPTYTASEVGALPDTTVIPAPYDDSVIQARMDTFTQLAAGSTTGDAELMDGRVGADGVTYTNIGGAIRGQVSDLKSALSGTTRNLLDPRLMYQGTYAGVTYTYANGKYTANGTATGSGTNYSQNLGLSAGETYTFCAFADSNFAIKGYIRTFDSNNTTLQTEMIEATNTAKKITLHANTVKTVWSFGLVSGTTYNDVEFRFQCVKGSAIGDYIPHITAVDRIARSDLSDLQTDVLDITTITKALNNGKALQPISLTFYQGEVHNRNYYNPNLQNGTIYSNLIENKGLPLHISVANGYKALVVEFDANYDYVEYAEWITGEVDYYKFDKPYASIELRPTSGNIVPSEGSNVSASFIYGEAFSKEATYYVSPSGSDSNSGLTRSAPFATIQKAINSGGKVILVKEGTYTQGFTLDGKNGVSIVIDHYYDTYTVVTDEDNPKIVIDGTNNSVQKGAIITNCTNCNFGNIEVKNTTVTGFTIQKCDGLRFDDCIAHDIGTASPSGYVGGFIVERTNADFYNCVAYNIGTTSKGQQTQHCDGFNIHYTGTTNFINCKAWNCEDDGISHHDACCGLVDGGEWYNCGKGGVATPTHGAKVNISNVYCHDNNVGIYAGNDSAVTDRGNIIMSNCVCKNNDNEDMIVSNYYKVIAINCVYDTITGGSNVTRFGITS